MILILDESGKTDRESRHRHDPLDPNNLCRAPKSPRLSTNNEDELKQRTDRKKHPMEFHSPDLIRLTAELPSLS